MHWLVEAEETDEQPVKPVEKAASRPDRNPISKQNEDNKPRWTAPPEPSALPAPPQPYKLAIPGQLRPQCRQQGKNKLVLTQPSGFDDAQQIAENVTNGKTVLVNFDRTDAETTKRTIDFMSGITYAVGGTVQRIFIAIFLFAPSEFWYIPMNVPLNKNR